MLTEGDTAPDFILPGTDGEKFREYALTEFVGDRPVVVAFYHFDFHPDCVETLTALRDRALDAAVVGVSTDSAFSHAALAREHDVDFPLLSDSTGTASDAYGVLRDGVEAHGLVSERALFVLEDWTVRYAWGAADPADVPELDPVAAAVDAA